MSTTYTRALDAYPERVGKAGRWAPVGGRYAVAVIHYSGDQYRWALHHECPRDRGVGRFITGGTSPTAEQAWRDGCAAMDERRSWLLQVMDTAILTVRAEDVRVGDHLMSGRRVSAVLPAGPGTVDIHHEVPVIFPAEWCGDEWRPRVECDRLRHTVGTVYQLSSPVQVIR